MLGIKDNHFNTFLNCYSGDYSTSRGSGRGRGSRGRRRAIGEGSSYNSDYLYYMNEAGARGGAFLPTGSATSAAAVAAAAAAAASAVSNGGSPSRGDSGSSSGVFDPYADQEELLFNEQYPGKLCALCNLSERSALGQGDMVKYKLPADFDLSAEIKRRRSALNSGGSGSPSSASLSAEAAENNGGASPKNSGGGGLNARRKGRKFTSGDLGSEPMDELDNVGFMEEPDHGLLFESSGEYLQGLFRVLFF